MAEFGRSHRPGRRNPVRYAGTPCPTQPSGNVAKMITVNKKLTFPRQDIHSGQREVTGGRARRKRLMVAWSNAQYWRGDLIPPRPVRRERASAARVRVGLDGRER